MISVTTLYLLRFGLCSKNYYTDNISPFTRVDNADNNLVINLDYAPGTVDIYVLCLKYMLSMLVED